MMTLPNRIYSNNPISDYDNRCLPWVIDLVEWLRLSGYELSSRQRIMTSLLDHGTLAHAADCGLIDREDYPLAEAIFAASQPEVPQDDPAWDDADTWELGPPIPPDTVLIPPELDDDQAEDDQAEDEQPAARPDWRNWESLVDFRSVKPISGGGPVSLLEKTAATIDRCADLAEKIMRLQAELDAVPADWSENHYPFMGARP